MSLQSPRSVASRPGTPGGTVLEAPASPTQRSSLLMSAFNPSREFMSWIYQLNGRLDVPALARAIDDVVARHDMLRVRFVERASGPEQVVTPFRPGVLNVVPLDDRPKLEALTTAVRSVEIEYQDLSPWDDARLQATLYLVAPKTNVLSVWVAEAAIDGDSGTLVAADISRAYAAHAGRPAPDLPEPSDDSYLRFVLEHPVAESTLERAGRYWVEEVPADPEAGSWPTVAGDRSLTRFFNVPSAGWERLVEATPALGTLPYVVVLSWLEMALCAVSGAEHFVVTSAVSGRRLPVTRAMIGNFVGPVRLKAEVHPDDTLEDVSPRVMTGLRAAMTHGVVPAPLAEAEAVGADRYSPPPPTIGFYLFAEREGLDLAGVRQRRFRVHTGNRDILRVNCTPDGDGGRNFFFISASAPPVLLDALVGTFRSIMGA
ncbi:MAG: condensation domain-containing protein [Acidimicrobiales bacterium]